MEIDTSDWPAGAKEFAKQAMRLLKKQEKELVFLRRELKHWAQSNKQWEDAEFVLITKENLQKPKLLEAFND